MYAFSIFHYKFSIFHFLIFHLMFNQKKPFNLTPKEQIIEVIGIAFFLAVLVGSFLKVLFL